MSNLESQVNCQKAATSACSAKTLLGIMAMPIHDPAENRIRLGSGKPEFVKVQWHCCIILCIFSFLNELQVFHILKLGVVFPVKN